MPDMLELLKEIYPHFMAPVSEGTDIANAIYCRELPFTVHEYACGSEYNGWQIPQGWKPLKAEIRKDGELIYDGTWHHLGVWGYSQSFQGTIDLEELKKHLAYSEEWDDAIVYYGDLYYKLGRKDWGFSIPKALFQKLLPGNYTIDLQTEFVSSTLKVLDYFVSGKSPETIVLNAHNCHAAQANDDTSGCVVGVEIMKRVLANPGYYSFRLLICPELYGTLFWLRDRTAEERQNLKLETKEEILSEIKRAVEQESHTKENIEEELVKNAIEGEDIEPKEELEDPRARIISELKAVYRSDLV